MVKANLWIIHEEIAKEPDEMGNTYVHLHEMEK